MNVITSPWTVAYCPTPDCGCALDGGPVMYWCCRCGRSTHGSCVLTRRDLAERQAVSQ